MLQYTFSGPSEFNKPKGLKSESTRKGFPQQSIFAQIWLKKHKIAFSEATCATITNGIVPIVKPELENIKIFPINIGKDNFKKSEQFFNELNIKNLNIYFDNPKTLAKDLNLIGVPTTILFNKDNKEFARVIGSIDFEDEEFVRWIKNFN